MADSELESKVREALHGGSVSEAQGWAESIQDARLRAAMFQLIREYERG